MQIGYIGLGKMGLSQVERLKEKGHDVVAYNRSEAPRIVAEDKGVKTVSSIKDLCGKLEGTKVIWLMVSWQAVDGILDELLDNLNEGDIIIDGGNSPYKKTIERSKLLNEKHINFLDVGVSGGPSGARNGACLMVGGDKENYEKLLPLFTDMAIVGGIAYAGRSGAGHFVKMVHNGIEYGMMQAIGEGFEIMKKSDFGLPLKDITELYNHGSVIESRLIGWLRKAFDEHTEDLSGVSGEVAHSGEGQWTVETAKELGVPVKVIEESLQFRQDSEGNPSYTGQVVSALRNQFGGHDVGKK